MFFNSGKGIVYLQCYSSFLQRDVFLTRCSGLVVYEGTSENRDYLSENRPLNFNDIFTKLRRNLWRSTNQSLGDLTKDLTKEETTLGKYQLAQTFLR